MHYKRIINTLGAVVAFTVVPASAVSSLELSLESSSTVPGLNNPIQRVRFADYDRDGRPEVLACNGEAVVLYSPTEDRTDVTFAIRSGYTDYTLLFDDVNRDSIPDILIGYYFNYGTYGADTVCCLDFCDGADLLGERLSFFFEVTRDSPVLLSSPFNMVHLNALDINADGYHELLFSYDDFRTYDMLGSSYLSTTGTSAEYFSFPDSLISARKRLYNDIEYVGAFDNSPYFVTTDHTTLTQMNTASDIFYSRTTLSTVILNADESPVFTLSALTPYYPMGDSASVLTTAEYLCFGDIDGSKDSDEILLKCDFRHSSFADGVCIIDTSTSALLMYRMISPNSFDPLWIAADPTLCSQFFYAPAHPGYFFGIDGGKVFQYDGTDGTLVDTIALIDADSVFWLKPSEYGGGHIIAIKDQTVFVYNLDQSTPVRGEPSESQLPADFTLHQPYPNPFNAEVSVSVTVNSKENLKIDVYDLLGRRVANIFDGPAASGDMKLRWDASDNASGIYFIRATDGDHAVTVKAVLLK